nr:hypothetical protein GCM10020093_012340 [Planobispora longispora]
MHAFNVLGDPVRRRILELLADGEMTSGEVCGTVQREFGISQPAVSQHLKVLRESGFATVRAEGTRRLYAVNSDPLREVDVWLDRFRRFWTPIWTRWRRNWPGAGANAASATPMRTPPGRGRVHDRRHPPDQRRPAEGRHARAGGGEARTVTISRTYDAPVDDVWDACTNPERIPGGSCPSRASSGSAAGTRSKATPAGRSSAATRPRASPPPGSTETRSAGSRSC